MLHQVESAKTIVIALTSLIALLFSSLLVSASPTSETVSISTGDVELSSRVKVRLICSLNVKLYSTSDTIEPGKSSTWYIQINSPGTVSLSVFIPSPYNDWYTTSKEFTSITSTLHIPIVSGLSATLKTNPSASLNINGPGSLSTSSMSFDYMGSSESFTVSSYTSASNGAKITVNADFKIGISVGLSIDLLLFSQQIASTSIGQFSMTPSISDSMTVSIPSNPIVSLITNPLFVILGFVIGSFSIIGLAIRRSYRKNLEKQRARSVSALEQVRKLAPKPLKRHEPVAKKIKPQKQVSKPDIIYCLYCGEKLPSYAGYCRKCGKKVE